jgi:hypothetical protein
MGIRIRILELVKTQRSLPYFVRYIFIIFSLISQRNFLSSISLSKKVNIVENVLDLIINSL